MESYSVCYTRDSTAVSYVQIDRRGGGYGVRATLENPRFGARSLPAGAWRGVNWRQALGGRGSK